MFNKNLTVSLLKILLKNDYSLGDFLAGFKKGAKSVIKNIMIILLAGYGFGTMFWMYITSMLNSNKLFLQLNAPDAMAALAVITSVMIIVFFGFTSIATNYYVGPGEEQFRSMPLANKDIFIAKVLVSIISDAILGIIIYSISAVIYGKNQNLLTKPLFYLGILVSGIFVAVVVVFVIYLIFILFLTIFPGLRKKTILTTISTVLLVIFYIGYSLISTKASTATTSQDFESMVPFINWIINISEESLIVRFLSDAIKGKILSIVLMIVFTAIVIVGVMPLVSTLYINSLNGFSDIKTKRLNSKQTEELVNKEVKTTSVRKALYMRDLRTVLREPAFFSNGPLMIFIMPLIIIVSMCAGFISAGDGSFSQLITEIRTNFDNMSFERIKEMQYYILLVLIAFTFFISNGSAIAATSFSREGKSFFDLKAMPFEYDDIVFAKFWHSLTYVFVAIVEMSIFLIAALIVLELPFSINDIVHMLYINCVVILALSLLLIFIDMFLDTVNPKLKWENPTVAVKQNINALIGAVTVMIVVALFVVVSLALPKKIDMFLIIAVFFGVIDAIVGSAYFRYARKKLPSIE